MFLYEKKIGYLSLYQDGEKKSSVGFLRIERERNACRLEIHIKKGAEVYNGSYPLMLITKSGEFPWGTVKIRKEEDFTEKNFPIQGDMFCLEGECVREDDGCGVSIRLDESRRISGFWKENVRQVVPEKNAERDENGKSDKRPENRTASHEKSVNVRADEKNSDIRQEAERVPETVRTFAENQELHAAGGHQFEDKWINLQRDYKKVHPFGDERTFLSVELRDFQLLKPQYQRLSNNSFLLHGFYNYRHLILGPDHEMGGNDGICFYLGVPGTYFEREKMVAVMFGFEGFECSGAVETGKFGYYMRRVELR